MRRGMMKATTMLWVLLLASCSFSGQSSDPLLPPKPVIDLSTPDRALKTYWALRDWGQEVQMLGVEAWRKKHPEDIMNSLMAKVTYGDTLAFWSPPPLMKREKLSRSIESVKQETESRAVTVARIRNVTEIPPEATPTSEELKKRETGVIFRYILEKDGNEWKVSEVVQVEGVLGERKLYKKQKASVPYYVYSD